MIGFVLEEGSFSISVDGECRVQEQEAGWEASVEDTGWGWQGGGMTMT